MYLHAREERAGDPSVERVKIKRGLAFVSVGVLGSACASKCPQQRGCVWGVGGVNYVSDCRGCTRAFVVR